ncbi:MAG: YraN family protein [Stappiaceae bacterium]
MARQAKTDRKKAYLRGHMAEWVAVIWLSFKGYRILARRFKTGRGEIDIIARRGNTVAFVEVKYRRSLDEALLAVTVTNQKRIIAASNIWLSGRNNLATCTYRYDIFAVMPRRRPVHLENAFSAEVNN